MRGMTATATLVEPIRSVDAVGARVEARRRTILGVTVEALLHDEAVAAVRRAIAERTLLRINFLNANNANIATADPALASALRRSLVLADGIGVDIASRMLYGAPFPDNLNGTDFVPRLLGDLRQPLTIGLLGGSRAVVEQAARKLAAKVPQHSVIVIGDGYFSDDAEAASRVRAVKPDILLVAMGTPRQETFADAHIKPGDCGIVITVGALFDFMAERVTRAPELLRRARLEWVYRLALEPGRLARRYLLGNPVFLTRVMLQKMSGRADTAAPAPAVAG